MCGAQKGYWGHLFGTDSVRLLVRFQPTLFFLLFCAYFLPVKNILAFLYFFARSCPLFWLSEGQEVLFLRLERQTVLCLKFTTYMNLNKYFQFKVRGCSLMVKYIEQSVFGSIGE
jgi:hypothetical protein